VGPPPTWDELSTIARPISVLIQESTAAVGVDSACREYTSTREDTYEMEDCRRAALRAFVVLSV
jgi:hypothetical protein